MKCCFWTGEEYLNSYDNKASVAVLLELLAEPMEPVHDLYLVASAKAGIALQSAVISCFRSDGSLCMKSGHVPRAACLCFATENTHGYEIASLDALVNLIHLLRAFCLSP